MYYSGDYGGIVYAAALRKIPRHHEICCQPFFALRSDRAVYGGKFSFSFELPQTDTQQRTEKTVEAAQSYLTGVIEERLNLTLSEALALKGIEGVKIHAEIHMEADGSIIIDRITALDFASEDRSAIQAYIEEQTGVSPSFRADA